MNTFYEHFINFLCKINAELFFETNNLNKFANFLQITNNLNYLQYLQLYLINAVLLVFFTLTIINKIIVKRLVLLEEMT